MIAKLFLQGLAIGFAIAAPVGPIGILCIRRTLVFGRFAGIISGLGAATADAFYGAVAAFGLTIVSGFLIEQNLWLRIGGGLFLLYLGLKIMLAGFGGNKTDEDLGGNKLNVLGYYSSTFLLTISNPLTILSFSAIIVAFVPTSPSAENLPYATLMVIGIFIGSSLWWLLLSFVTHFARERLNIRSMIWINRVAGVTICIFGILALSSASL